MNESELDRLLKSAPTPDRSPEFWEQFPSRLTAKIQWREKRASASEETPRKNCFSRTLRWAIAGAAACIMIGFVIENWRSDSETNGLLRNEKVIREVLTMFPNQVRAIVQDEKGLRIALADKPDVPASTPLWIKVCDGKHCRSIVTFSGQSVQIAGQQVEVLADARGDVMLMGDRFFWSSSGDSLKDNLRIDARQLNQIL